MVVQRIFCGYLVRSHCVLPLAIIAACQVVFHARKEDVSELPPTMPSLIKSTDARLPRNKKPNQEAQKNVYLEQQEVRPPDKSTVFPVCTIVVFLTKSTFV